ncbi:hypothetical protein MW887_004688 [Aspergillus wentii]|nr:hypothetical protein MW887_004688 [Aspergillus wentii]
MTQFVNTIEAHDPDREIVPTFDSHDADLEKHEQTGEEVDAFGNEEFAEVKYKVLSWWQCSMLMVAETVSLGILSLPAVVAALGFVPGMIIIVGLGIIATYTGYSIGQFKWRYPQAHSMGDAGGIIAGRFGQELLGNGQLLILIFIMASHLLTFSVAMNTITDHGTCSIVFGVIGMVVSFICCLPRTSGEMSWLSVGFDTTLADAFNAVCNIVFAFAAHACFFGFASELKDVKEFPKSLFMLQGIEICLYIAATVVLYYYAGADVASPALGSASPIVRKVAYGIALPTILIAGVVNGHVAAKYVYVRIFRNSDRMHKRDFVAVGSWVGIGALLWIIAWVIAEAIPVFQNLLSLIAALFSSWFTYGIGPILWLHLNKNNYFTSFKQGVLTIINVAIICMTATICGVGLYASGKTLHDNPSSASFSCANNA